MKLILKRIICFTAGIGIIAALFLFVIANDDLEERMPIGVLFSVESGFYDEPFDLELYCDSGEIHYTLDSSDPDENSPLYTAPIHIEDASVNENVYSNITDVCLDLNKDILAEYHKKALYGTKVPSGTIDKATVVRAVCIDPSGTKSGTTCGVYFVGYDQKKAYEGINIITINTDPVNLFGYEEGIYVLGKTFYDALENGIHNNGKGSYLFWEANYKNKGKDWERPANISFFDKDRNLVLSGDFGIRIQGRGSRGYIPRSLNIYARKSYGSPSVSGEVLFGLDYPLTKLNLYAGGNDINTMMKDPLVNCLTSDLKFGTRPYEPYALFLDGEYWGLYWLTPRYKKDYFAGEYGLDEKDVIETKPHNIEIGNQDDFQLYKDVFDTIAAGDMSNEEQFAQACEMIDIESCIDYYATEIYIANTDWPTNNFSLWRTRKVSNKPFADGKWRWLMYDVNISMNVKSAHVNMIDRAIGKDAMFCSLMINPGFKSAIEDKLVDLAQGCFAPDRVDAYIQEYESTMADAMEMKYDRFNGGTRTKQDFLDKCELIRAFFHDRYEYIMRTYGALE